MSQTTLTFLLAPQPPADESSTDSGADWGADWGVGRGSELEDARDVTCWQTRMAQWLGATHAGSGETVGSGHSVPVGQALRFEDAVAELPSAPCLRADPVHMIPDRDRALLLPPQTLELSAPEVQTLVADLNDFLKDDPLTLVAPHAERWYLSGDTLVSMTRPSPEQLAYTDVGPDETAASTEDALREQRRMRSLMSEIEMFLYTHPVNEERRRQARPTVAGLYLWGSLEPLNIARHENVTLVGDDPWIRYMADVADVPHSVATRFADLVGEMDVADDQPHRILVVETDERRCRLAGDAGLTGTARQRFVEHWLDPAVAARHAGELDALEIEHDDGVRRVIEPPRGGVLRRAIRRVFG